MIYLIECSKTNSCKIGYSKNPENRLVQLQTGNPFSLKLVTTIEGEIIDEKLLHEKFKEYKLQGEWFDYSDEIKNFFNVEEFMYFYSGIIGAFMEMSQSEIRIFGYCLRYAKGVHFDISKNIRLDISRYTGINERTVLNTIPSLLEKKLLYKHESGLYQINPRYAFEGSTVDRNNELKVLISLGCKDC